MHIKLDQIILKKLHENDVDELFLLINENKDHLTRIGDYYEYVTKTIDEHRNIINSEEGQLGIFYQNKIIGLISVTLYDKNIYGLGYWLSKEYTGRGYMKKSLEAVVNNLIDNNAMEIWAGISHSNVASKNLVVKLNFKLERINEKHDSYLLKPKKHNKTN